MVNSPPGMKTISAPSLALGPPPRFTLRAMLIPLDRLWRRFCRWEDRLPIVLHVDHGPAFGRRLVERLVELADVGLAVVGIFAHRVGVMHQPHEAQALAERGPFQHLLVAVGVAEGEDRLAPDDAIDGFRLARPIIDEEQLELF